MPPSITPSNSEESEAEVERLLQEFESAMSVIKLWLHTCDVSNHVIKIEAFMQERQNTNLKVKI